MKKRKKRLTVLLLCSCLIVGNATAISGATMLEDESLEQSTEVSSDEKVEEIQNTEDDTQAAENEDNTASSESEMTENATEESGTEEDVVSGETETTETETEESTTEKTETTEEIGSEEETETEEEAETEVETETEEEAETESVEKAAGMVNIKVGDNSFAVDTSAARSGLQKALDYIDQCNKSGNTKVMTVKLPAGTYVIEQTLDIYSNTKIDLSAGAVLKRGCDSAMILFGRSDEETKGYNGYHDISIVGGKLDGNAGTKSIVRFAHAQNITFQNVHFTNVTKAHHMEFAASKNVLIDGCTFDGFAPVNLKSNTNYEAVQIDILQTGHFPNYGKYDGTLSSDITITNNTFKGLNRGVGCHSAELGRYFDNINISQNTFDDITGYAIVTTNFRNATINNNKITNAGAGIYFRHITPDYVNYYSGEAANVNKDMNSQINGNTISLKKTNFSNTPYGISVYGEKVNKDQKQSYTDDDTKETVTVTIPKGDYRVSGISISKNTVSTQTAGYGVWLRGVCSSSINGNTVTYSISDKADNECDGIRLEYSEKNKVSGNTITDQSKTTVLRDGIYVKLNSPANVLENNTVSSVKENGIYVSESEGCSIKNNTISNVEKHGIYVDQNSGTSSKPAAVDGNNVKTIGGRGICINDKTVANVSNNIINKTVGEGIYFGESSGGTAVSNTITDTKEQGIYLNTKSNLSDLSGNKISVCGQNGIYVNAGAKATVIKKNSICDVKKHGIYLNGTVVGKITGNTIAKKKNKTSSVRGICVNGTSASVKEVSSNKISDCNEHGIMVNEGASVKTVASNTVKTVKVNGIYANQKTKVNVISKNVITGAKNAGICANSNKVKIQITGNKINSCKTYGIDLCKGISGNVTNNQFEKTKVQLRVRSLSKSNINTQSFKIAKLSASKGKINVTYKKIKGANTYVIYRAASKNGTYKKVGTANGTKYVDKNVKKGKTYYYKVAPAYKAGKLTAESGMSAAKNIKAK